ncbi:MAG: DEAD/DEAH box helicase [Sphingomonas sp.]|uniref:helicase-related protein n=1 Tax=Sphingomonas sp. TaxID=28214 RepID=UPI001AD0690E|nr:helicase-related protein [Sphingomonas sp.]MBN8808280.1 DEAD/DEAH box helicase [Sphingomonas sp.]
MIVLHLAFRIAARLGTADVICLTDDEQQAEELARLLAVLVPENQIVQLPSSDALPGDAAPPSPANSGRRVAALRALRQARQSVKRPALALILSGEAAARRYPEPEAFDSAPPTLEPDGMLDPEQFAKDVAALGYLTDDRVDEPGEVAIRGDVIDIFPADAHGPARIDLADGKVVQIRTYDPLTQLSSDALASLEIGRAAEPPAGDAVPILDHLAPAALMCTPKAEGRRQRFVQLASEVAGQAQAATDAIDNEHWERALKGWEVLDAEPGSVEPIPRFAEQRTPLAAFAKFVQPLLASRAFILTGAERDVRFLRGRVGKKLKQELQPLQTMNDIEALSLGSAGVLEMASDAGFVDAHRVVVAAADIIGSRALLGDAPAGAANTVLAISPDVRTGDVVIHEEFGIARVLGLEPAPEGSETGELIALEFAKQGRRLVAADDADRIWRYGADADAVSLDTLNGTSWEKRRSTIEAAIAESARGLVALAAERATLEGVAIDPNAADYERFANGFPFNETADQARAIAAVRADLASGRPMDRLVVGDVGYGKTEVALRAVALAALAGHQVIVAAPTTVLVRQHFESFQKRFAGTGITVASLSRLSSAVERKKVTTGLADGSIDIVIGTAAVVAKGVSYTRLGLVVIDEEQRFGAANKAKLRGSGDMHLLVLSATPIPRTLQMALVGLQQISVIATPPARRQPIRTSLDQYDDSRIRTALLREKGRGGQSFVVVPRIEDMAAVAEKLRRIAPALDLVEAHGKMPATEIDAAMVGFAAGRGDILLATNIIEAGLDVPRANTMIVWRADRFGLAQLHQLRGRVGRGNRRGQVILLTDSQATIGERTLKRLRTLAAFDRLGAGFEISARDLDMRGSGDLLGDTQAGHVKLIGTELYQYLLGAALSKARGEEADHWAPELHIGVPGHLPVEWIPDTDIRLSLYVRLARMTGVADIDAFEDELADRFGPLPPPAEALVARARIRSAARLVGIARIDAGAAAIALTQRSGGDAKFEAAGLREKDGRFLLVEHTDDDTRLARLQELVEQIAD